VAFGHEDGAVGRDEHVIRLVEVAGRGRAAARAKRHQQLAVRTELEDLAAARGAGRRTGQRVCLRALRTRRVVLTVGHPYVAVAIDEDAVRKEQQPGAEALHELSRRVEFQDRRQVRSRA
jgi:hypothetical protein